MVATTAVKATGAGLGLYVKYILINIFIFMIIINSINIAVEKGDWTMFFKDLGQRLVGVSEHLHESSTYIIENKTNLLENKNLWQLILLFCDYLANILIFISWIQVFVWIVERTPISYEGNFFVNYLVAILMYIMFQFIYLIIIAGMAGTLHTWIGGSDSVSYYLSLPIGSLIDFGRAMLILISPIAEKTMSWG